MPPTGSLHPIRRVTKGQLAFTVWIDGAREYRWSLFAGNNYEIANSGEGYKHVADCVHAINLIATKTSGIPIRAGRGVTLP
jgi:uncharacterized protein YegP (UPF0339 family)